MSMAASGSFESSLLRLMLGTSFVFSSALLTYSYYANARAQLLESNTGSTAKQIAVQATKPKLVPDSVLARLVAKKYISPDTVWLDFRFVNGGARVPVGKHVKIYCKNPCKGSEWNGKADGEAGKEIIERKYTPISSSDDGFVLVVKSYRPNDKFSHGGKCSQYLADLVTDETIEVALPYGIMEYVAPGQLKRSKTIANIRHIGMLAGGSGITPMYRLLEASLSDPKDTTKYSLIFANRSVHDILLRDKLEKLAETYPNRFRIAYTLTRPPEDWKGEVGLITQDMIKAYMPPPSPECLILCCGPPAMIKTCCKDNLEALHYAPSQIWDF